MCQRCKTFYGRNLQMLVESFSVCPWQAFPAYTYVCRLGPEWSTWMASHKHTSLSVMKKKAYNIGSRLIRRILRSLLRRHLRNFLEREAKTMLQQELQNVTVNDFVDVSLPMLLPISFWITWPSLALVLVFLAPCVA